MIRPFLERPPEAPVAVGDRGPRTVGDLRADAARIAAALADLPPGDVLLACEDRYRFAAALLGTWRAGRVATLPPNGAPGTIHALSGGSAVGPFLHDRDGTTEGVDTRALLAGPPGGPDVRDGWPELPPERPVVALYTSGSTGAHQRWEKTAGQLLGEARVLADTFAIGAGDVILPTVPALHIYGLLFGVLLPLHAGAAFTRETPLHPEAVAACARRFRATLLASVPAHLRALGALEALPPFRRVFSSGAPLPAADGARVGALAGGPVVEIFGSSETGGIAWRSDPAAAWTPFTGVRVDADPDGRLLVDSPRLAPGCTRPFPCGDRIALGPDGAFTLLGRLDGVVKLAGKRVSLAEVEGRARALPGVRDAAALAVPVAGARGLELRLVVEAGSDDAPDAAAIRKALSAWLDPATLPRRIRIVPELPREPTGKVRRSALLELFEVRDLEPTAAVPGRDAGGRETWTLAFDVPEELHHFRGHFPGHPVLPAVFQLEGLVLRQIARRFPGLGAPRRVLRLKFKRLVGPGSQLRLRLTRAPSALSVDFDLEDPRGSCASGTLVFAGEP